MCAVRAPRALAGRAECSMRSGLLLRAPAAPRPRQHTHRRRRQGFNIQKRSASVSIVTDGAEEGESSSEVDTCALDSFLAAKGAAALLGWTVVHHRDGAAVGTVAEVLRCAHACLSYKPIARSSSFVFSTQHGWRRGCVRRQWRRRWRRRCYTGPVSGLARPGRAARS